MHPFSLRILSHSKLIRVIRKIRWHLWLLRVLLAKHHRVLVGDIRIHLLVHLTHLLLLHRLQLILVSTYLGISVWINDLVELRQVRWQLELLLLRSLCLGLYSIEIWNLRYLRISLHRLHCPRIIKSLRLLLLLCKLL